MKTYTKNFVGKGTQVKNMDIVTCCISIDKLMENSFEYEGVTYAKFEVAKLKTPDKFGKTHCIYFSVKEDVLPVASEPKAPKTRKKKVKEETQDLPW